MNCIRQFLPHITLEVGPKCTRFFAPVVLLAYPLMINMSHEARLHLR